MKNTISTVSTTVKLTHLLNLSALTKKDLDSLAKSYITPELARRAKIGRVDSQEGAEMFGRKATARKNYAGLVFPYYWPGQDRPGEMRLRRDQPELEKQSDGTTKEKEKYLSPPGRRNALYFPPDTPHEYLTDVAIGAVITEGEKKALALSRYFSDRGEDRMVIGLSGVWNWRGTIGNEIAGNGQRQDVKGVIEDFEKIQWEGRAVWIVFDANVQTNDSVKWARQLLAKELTRRGALVRSLDLPTDVDGINGIDDLLAQKGAEFVTALFASLDAATARKTTTRTIGDHVFKTDDKGVWAIEIGTSKRWKVCAPLFIEVDMHNTRNEGWGRLLVFRDREGNEKSWVMPHAWLTGDRSRYREKLLDMGLALMPGRDAENLLHHYLFDQPERVALSVDRVGWAEDAFVFPDSTIGKKPDDRIYLQASSGINNQLVTAGTLNQWQKSIGSYCIGNSRLVFAVSAAFAASLLLPFGIESGGFHFMGKSSVGKSTSQYLAGSVWGGGGKFGYVQTWKSTATALEYLSEYHNDNLLCLDEIGEANPKDIGQSVYMIANGRGKNRSQGPGGLRRQASWNVLALSSGEKTLKEYMADAGEKIKEGQEVRLIHLPADAGAGWGAFEDLHEFNKGKPLDDGKAFSDYLRGASLSYYGTPISAFLDRLINQRLVTTSRQKFETYKRKFIAENLKDSKDNVAGRAADRFAIVGFAGQLASEWGITDWPSDEAPKAAAKLFHDWMTFQGQRDGGEDAGVNRVIEFIQRHSSSRFQYVDSKGKSVTGEKIINQAGFRRYNEKGDLIEYAIFPGVFQTEVCAGLTHTDVAQRLHEKGLLNKGDGKNWPKYCTIGEFGRKRYFVIRNLPDGENVVGQVGQSDTT